jgi:uncharacterized membrane protein
LTLQARFAAFGLEPVMPSFAIYALGFLVIVGGLAYGAYLLAVPQQWIIVGALVLLGLGITTGVVKTRQKDTPEQ